MKYYFSQFLRILHFFKSLKSKSTKCFDPKKETRELRSTILFKISGSILWISTLYRVRMDLDYTRRTVGLILKIHGSTLTECSTLYSVQYIVQSLVHCRESILFYRVHYTVKRVVIVQSLVHCRTSILFYRVQYTVQRVVHGTESSTLQKVHFILQSLKSVERCTAFRTLYRVLYTIQGAVHFTVCSTLYRVQYTVQRVLHSTECSTLNKVQ